MRMMWASAVSAPVLATRKEKLPVVLIVPPTTLAPMPFVTGVGSPVSIEFVDKDEPSITCPSTGTLSPGLTRTMSPTKTSSRGISTSPPRAAPERFWL